MTPDATARPARTPLGRLRPRLGLLAVVSLLLGAPAALALPPAGAIAPPSANRRPAAAPNKPVACASVPPGVPAGPAVAAAGQAIVVLAPSSASTFATMRRWQRRADGCFISSGPPLPARVGRNGLSAHHLEGDGTTPIGTYRIAPVMYGIGPDPGVHYPWHHLVCGDWWDEDPSTALYNRFVHVPCGTAPPFGGNSEALWTEAPAYDVFAVVEYNAAPAVPGRGSAIFLHVGIAAPTDGCVSLAAAGLLPALRWLRPGEHPVVVIEVTSRY